MEKCSWTVGTGVAYRERLLRPSFPVPSTRQCILTAAGRVRAKMQQGCHGRTEFILWQLYQHKLWTMQQVWHVDVSCFDLCQADKQHKLIPVRGTGQQFSTELAVIVTFAFPQTVLLVLRIPSPQAGCSALSQRDLSQHDVNRPHLLQTETEGNFVPINIFPGTIVLNKN